MTGRRASLIWLVVLSTLLGVFALAWLVPRLNRMAEQARTLNRLESEGRTLGTRAEDLARELGALLSGEDPASQTAPVAVTSVAPPGPEEMAKRLEQVRLLAETQDRLAETTATVEDLRQRFRDLEAVVSRTTAQNEALAASEEALKDRLAGSDRIIEALQVELDTNSDRLVKLEARNRSLRKQNTEAENRIARSSKLLRDLENVHRRQEALLTGILRRYNEVNDQYRSATLRLNNPQQDAPEAGVDLSRIQHAITLAEEDLRQLRSLNVQAARIQKQLGR